MNRIKIAEIITQTHKTPLEQADEILLLFGVIKSVCCCDKPDKYIDYSLDQCMCKKCGKAVKD